MEMMMTVSDWHYQDGETELIGELHFPESPNGKAILVVHEADGIGGNVRRRCAMLAELGYVAAAADVHGEGRVLPDQEIGPALDNFRQDPPMFRRRVRAALDALCAAAEVAPDRTVAIGYCLGGLAVLELARSGAPFAAVASFHGLLTTRARALPDTITARVLACTGALDPLVPPSDIAAFQEEMTSARVDWHLLVHGRALHSYTNVAVDGLGDPRMRYDAAADRQSWSALMVFLDETFG
jgi:dienelactone hydrolase